MVNGLTTQLATSVAIIGLGVLAAFITWLKSICTMMGYIIKNKQTATGIDTLATVSPPSIFEI